MEMITARCTTQASVFESSLFRYSLCFILQVSVAVGFTILRGALRMRKASQDMTVSLNVDLGDIFRYARMARKLRCSLCTIEFLM